MICKGKEGKWELASCVVVGKLCTVGTSMAAGKLWQLASCVAASNLYIISKLCELTSCVPLASFVAVGIGRSLASDPVLAQMSQWPIAAVSSCVAECDCHRVDWGVKDESLFSSECRPRV
jgi:hypothetical protein